MSLNDQQILRLIAGAIRGTVGRSMLQADLDWSAIANVINHAAAVYPTACRALSAETGNASTTPGAWIIGIMAFAKWLEGETKSSPKEVKTTGRWETFNPFVSVEFKF